MTSLARIVEQLTAWAEQTDWIDWLELGGSLGRGAGDDLSDVDAGIGVSGDGCVDATAEAIARFAPVADILRQPFGSATHLIAVYRDGRQLSLVVMPTSARDGLPPECLALVDKIGRLSTSLDRGTWYPDAAKCREWTFLACIAACDALKHAARGRLWRSQRSLNEARELYLQLLAADHELIFPQFGAVTLENAAVEIPEALAATLAGLDPDAIERAVRTLMSLLEPYVREHDLDQLAAALRPAVRA